jgi:hypothetical protein
MRFLVYSQTLNSGHTGDATHIVESHKIRKLLKRDGNCEISLESTDTATIQQGILANVVCETMTVNERLKAVKTNLKLAGQEIEELRKLGQVDAETVRAVAKIAELHKHILTRIEEHGAIG